MVRTTRGGSLQDQVLVKDGGDCEEQEGGAGQENYSDTMEGTPSNRPTKSQRRSPSI
jgi:hypothetical protein